MIPFAAYTAAGTLHAFNGPDNPQNCPSPDGISTPSNTWFQSASRSRAHENAQQTDKHTDKPRYSVCSNRPHLRSFTSSSRTAFTDYCPDHYAVFVFHILVFLIFFLSMLCGRLRWPYRQLLGARKYIASYRIVSYVAIAAMRPNDVKLVRVTFGTMEGTALVAGPSVGNSHQ